MSVSISKEVRKGDGREVGKKGGWERGGKVEGDDGGGGGGERGTRDEVMMWSGRERLNFMGELWRRCEGREQKGAEQSRAEQSRAEQSRAEQSRAEQSRAEQSRAEQSRADKTRDTGNGKMEKWRNGKKARGKSAAMMYNVDRTGIRGGVRVCGCQKR